MTAYRPQRLQGERRVPETRASITVKWPRERIDTVHDEARRRGLTVTDFLWSLVAQAAIPREADAPLLQVMLEETEALCAPHAEMTGPQKAALLLHKVRILKAIHQYAGNVPPQEWGTLLATAGELQAVAPGAPESASQVLPKDRDGRRRRQEAQALELAGGVAAEQLARQIQEAQARARAALGHPHPQLVGEAAAALPSAHESHE